MEKIRLLDCTLRDGGYINDWRFGRRTIQNLLTRLVDAGCDLIEVGFLRNGVYDPDRTLFGNVKELSRILPDNRKKSRFVAMALHNQYDISQLEDNDGTLDAIRVTFHDYDIDEGLEFGRKVMEKGYRLFVNPINIMGYKDAALLKLLKKVRQLSPYGFSIVDTFGSMTRKELTRIYSLCENNLDKKTVLGLHLHENLALSFSLAQDFLKMREAGRKCVLDASLNGMGRVPGNLCMELLMDYMNKNYGRKYEINQVLDAIQEHILPIRQKESWGYSTEYFLSAKHNLHRNYAEYLQKKGTLTSRDMNQILKMIPEKKKAVFDEDTAEKLYRKYENRKVEDDGALSQLAEEFGGRRVVVLAPGKSLESSWKKVHSYIRREGAIPVSANFYFDEQEGGYAFFSNARRYEEYKTSRKQRSNVILTSNVSSRYAAGDLVINYDRLAYGEKSYSANCGILLLRLLVLLGVKEAALAGFDGYEEGGENYLPGYFGEFYGASSGDNHQIAGWLGEIREQMKLSFLTPSRYEEEIR
ncbi:MAG TPA: aldolase catalytic domain-containing protein [Candidatus Pullilachnospira intestinigallinarum]|nr:aldolase catalytic domain-containing protein [Candidatus Pullilachnospira intestinigallinarum]